METTWNVGSQAHRQVLGISRRVSSAPMRLFCHLCTEICDSPARAPAKKAVELTQVPPFSSTRSPHHVSPGQSPPTGMALLERQCIPFVQQGCPYRLAPHSSLGLGSSGCLSFPAMADCLLPRCLPKALVLQGSTLNGSWLSTSLFLPGAVWPELPLCGGRKGACTAAVVQMLGEAWKGLGSG